MKKIAIIVFYNSLVKDSITLDRLVENDIDLLIVDNSTIENDNDKICESKGYIYVNMHGNKGISAAYNAAFKEITKLNKYDYLMLCDDDTDFSQEYLSELDNLTNEHFDIIIPQIRSAHEPSIRSPRVKFKHSLMSKRYSGDDSYTSLRAINSGVCVSKKVFSTYKYDENLFLYFVDIDFFDDMNVLFKDNEITFKVMKSIVTQNFSEYQDTFKESDLKQMKMRLDDCKRFNKNYLSYITYKSYFILLMLIQHKNPKILKLINHKKI